MTAGLAPRPASWPGSTAPLPQLGLWLREGDPQPRQQAAEVVVAHCQSVAEVGDGGVLRGQLLLDRHRRAVLRLRLLRTARLLRQVAEVVVAECQSAAELGDGGFSAASFSWIASASRNSDGRFRWPTRLDQQEAEVVVAACQLSAEVGDGGVLRGQLLLDRRRLAVLRLALSFGRLAVSDCSSPPRLLWLSASSAAEVW